jgi:hypothetical protein
MCSGGGGGDGPVQEGRWNRVVLYRGRNGFMQLREELCYRGRNAVVICTVPVYVERERERAIELCSKRRNGVTERGMEL